jgi:PEGA domain
MRNRLGQALAIVLATAQVSVALPRPAAAQAPAISPKDEARERFDRGLKLFNEGDNAAALAEFKRAYELIPNQLVLFNIGLVYAAMNRPAEATDALGKVVADPGNLSPERLVRAKQTRDEQASRVAELTVVTNVPATIEIDNVAIANTPLKAPLRIAGGQRIIGAFTTGYAPLRKELTVAGGTKTELKLDLVAMEGKAAHLKVNTHLPAADVLVDGQVVGKTPLTSSLTVTPGQHKIELKRAGYVTAAQDLSVGDGATGDVTFEPEPDSALLATEGGMLALDISETQAVVNIDGKPRGPYNGSIKLPKGPHRLIVERGGFENSERPVSVDTAQTTTVVVEMVPTPETRAAYVSKAYSQRTWGWVSLLGGVAVAGGGTTLLVLDISTKDEARREMDENLAALKTGGNGKCDNSMIDPATHDARETAPCESAYNAAAKRLTDAQTRDKIGAAMAGVGGAAALLGVYLLISGDSPHRYDRKKEDNPIGLRVTPVVGPSGLGLVGTF